MAFDDNTKGHASQGEVFFCGRIQAAHHRICCHNAARDADLLVDPKEQVERDIAMTNAENITRQQLLQVYQQSPESAPLKMPALVSTQAAEDYRFEKLMQRFSSPTAAGLVDEATRDAVQVKQGSGLSMTKGLVTLCAGIASWAATPAFPLLFLVGLACIYFAMTWIRQANDKIRQSHYDTKFAADVVRYANQAVQYGG